MLAVALLVGGLVALVALGAVNVTGLGEERVDSEAEPTLHIPERTPGGDEDDEDPGLTLEDLTGKKPSETPSARPEESEGPRKKKPRKQRSVISLSASPLQVSAMQRIDLTGTFPGGEGRSLQVQRFQGGWSSFSGVSATVRGGTFSTYVMTGQTGLNRFRVMDPDSGKTSNPVRVRVG